jgi:hypothetical protein
MTELVLRALGHGETHFEGSDACVGEVREQTCSFELRFVAEAIYR